MFPALELRDWMLPVKGARSDDPAGSNGSSRSSRSATRRDQLAGFRRNEELTVVWIYHLFGIVG